MFGMCRKKTAVLNNAQYRRIVEGNAQDLFWSTEDPVIRQFCIDIMTKGFAPKVIVDYERIAFVEPITNVR